MPIICHSILNSCLNFTDFPTCCCGTVFLKITFKIITTTKKKTLHPQGLPCKCMTHSQAWHTQTAPPGSGSALGSLHRAPDSISGDANRLRMCRIQKINGPLKAFEQGLVVCIPGRVGCHLISPANAKTLLECMADSASYNQCQSVHFDFKRDYYQKCLEKHTHSFEQYA